MHTQDFNYRADDIDSIGYLAYDDAVAQKRPAVIVVHAFEGRNQLACDYADKIAALGYVGFAIDMYGNAETSTTIERSMELMRPCAEDRGLLRRRIVAAFEALKTVAVVDANSIGAMGFCFGGMSALDLARSGADVKGVVSIHGALAKAPDLDDEKITSKVLAVHGYNDPQVPPDQFTLFADEFNAAGVDWQMLYLSGAEHAFTDPNANEPELGRKYNALATDRAWRATVNFFQEVFGK